MTKADLVEQVAEVSGPGITKKDGALGADGVPNAVKLARANGVPVNVGGEALRGLATSPIDEVEAEATDDDAPAEEQPAEEADEATPVPLGISHLVAGPTPQPRWLLPMSAPEGSVGRVAVQNPGTEPRTVEISSLDGTSVGTLTLGSAAVEVVDVPAGIIVVDADGPIIAMGEWFGPEGGLGSTSGLVR